MANLTQKQGYGDSNNILSSIINRGKNTVESFALKNDLLKKQLEEKKEKELEQEKEKTNLEIFEKSLTTKDPVQKQSLKGTGRNYEVATMIRNYRKAWGKGKNDFGKDDQTIISEYIAHNPGSEDSINRYINGDGSATTLMYEMGWNNVPEKSSDGIVQTAKNVVGGALDSVTGLGKLASKGAADAIGWTAKKLGADEDKVNYYVNDFKDYMENEASDIGQDKESGAYQFTNTAGDIIQTATGEGVIKGGVKAAAKNSGRISKAIESISKIGKSIKDTPILGRLAKVTEKTLGRGSQGVADTIIYNAINGKGTTAEDADKGAMINIALGAGGNLLKGTYNKAKGGISKLMTAGLVNKQTLEATNNYLMQAEGASIPDLQATGKWLAERGFKGDKKALRQDLNNWVNTFRQAKREILDQSTTQVQSDAAHEALESIVKKYENQPGLSKALEGIKEKLAKDTYTIKELDEIKGIIDDSGLHIFNKNGTEADRIAAGGWNNLRREIKQQIEDVAEKEGLGNIAGINKEIQVAKALEEGIYQKELSQEVGDLMSKLNPRSLAYNSMISAATTTKNATTVANMLAKASGMSKKDISQLLGKNGKFSEDLLNKMFKGDENKANEFVEMLNKMLEKAPGRKLAEKLPYESAGNYLQKALLVETKEGLDK